jgi:hypothetical protein
MSSAECGSVPSGKASSQEDDEMLVAVILVLVLASSLRICFLLVD